MKLSLVQVNEVFDIMVNVGNFDTKNSSYTEYQREEFVHKIANEGMGEYWYSSNAGSSMKVYFGNNFAPTITFHAQTMNPIHEPNISENMNKAFAKWLSK